jgi:hypothetical protein
MDRFSGARYPATVMRRFYPAIYGRNLTFQPSQYARPVVGYGAEAASAEKQTLLSSIGSFFSETVASEGFKEAAGGITGTLLGKAMSGLDQKQLDREAKRQAMLAESAARVEESKARTVALQSALSSSGGAPSAVLWVGGGVALLVLVGGGIYFATRAPKAEKETA